jgi:hypothetical protein
VQALVVVFIPEKFIEFADSFAGMDDVDVVVKLNQQSSILVALLSD